MKRRIFLQSLAASTATSAARQHSPARGFLFKARGSAGLFGGGEKLAYMNTDGSGLRVFDFGRPNQMGWGVYDFFKDGRRALLLSIEMDQDWKTQPFSVYYPKSRTRIWICDLETAALTEIATQERMAPFYAPCALLPGEERMLVGVQMGARQQMFSMDLDGTRARRITTPDEFVYGVSLSHDGKRIAFHADYRIYTTNIDGSHRKSVAGHEGDIYFGTSWSPDDQWVLYVVCHSKADPGHDWCDVWIGRPDGSENVALTQGQAAWFAASYGPKDNPGSGSIMPRWAPDGSGILYARRLPDSKVPWNFQPQRTDTTHFNRDFKPELARGGAEISFLDPKTKKSTPLTHLRPAQWEFRPAWSPDSKQILFCRAGVGQDPAIRVMDRNGENQRMLTKGIGHGADFPGFLPVRS